MQTARGGNRLRQRGWGGLIVLLLALVIVGFLMRTVVRQMGLTDEQPVAATGTRATAGAAASGAGTAPSTPPQSGARAVEAEVLRQSAQAADRINAADK